MVCKDEITNNFFTYSCETPYLPLNAYGVSLSELPPVLHLATLTTVVNYDITITATTKHNSAMN